MSRHIGSSNEFRQQHEREIVAAYRTIFNRYGGDIPARTIYELVAKSPSSRFFISAKRAADIVQLMLAGRLASLPRSTNQRMYFEIYHRVKTLMREKPTLTVFQAVREVVCRPAPEMYKSPRQIMEILARYKNESKDID
ncbi:MAG: hypothetical protein HUK08_02200 [Bacteroidaceae bacterium]|nr:hypothetical protein [Bacteroidaceae bacterium]